MAHYECTCCGEPEGIAHSQCPNCKAGNCSQGKAAQKGKTMSEAFCNKCGFSGQADERGNHKRPSDGEVCHYVARTRPQPSAEPVAVWRDAFNAYGEALDWHLDAPNRTAHEASAAVIASALEAARREALEQAAKVAESPIPLSGVRPETFADQALQIATAIRVLKENPNAG